MEAGGQNLEAAALGPREEQMLQGKSKGQLLAEFLLQGRSIFVLLSPIIDWMGPSHIMEGNLLHSKSTHLNVNLT